MLEIKTELDKAEAQSYLTAHGISTGLDRLLVMCARDAGVLMGVGAVDICPGQASLAEVCCDDADLDYGMGKALLNLVDLGGIQEVICKNEKLFALAKRLGFRPDADGVMRLNLAGYFTSHC